MGDSWDDDDYEVNIPVLNKPAPTSWDDEEEEEQPVAVAPKPKGPPTAAQLKKIAEQQATKAAKLKAETERALQANETPEERRLRERQREEAADLAAAETLFGGKSEDGVEQAGGGGLDDLKLKSLQDHIQLAIQIGSKMEKSKANHLLAYFKELLNKTEGRMSVDDLTQLAGHITLAKERKAKAIAAGTGNVKKQVQQAVSKKVAIEKQKKHSDIFGGVDADHIDNMAEAYEDAYDDFM